MDRTTDRWTRRCVALALAGLAVQVRAELSLADAEALAVRDEPSLEVFREKAQALDQSAVADGQLPDPKLRLGLANLPWPDIDFGKEPMTQILIGVQQAFPAGTTLKHQSQRTARLADAERAAGETRAIELLRDVRQAWLETYYWVEAGRVVRESQDLFDRLVNITRARYGAGGENQQEVLQAELERELLNDREVRFRTMEERSRADLGRWVGAERAAEVFPAALPELPAVADRSTLLAALDEHPSIGAESQRVEAANEGVALARQAYDSSYMLDLSYGIRSGENSAGDPLADVASVMLVMDLPIFPGQRQDRRLEARRHEVTAALRSRDARLRELQRQLQETLATWTNTGERLDRYQRALIPRSTENVEAAINAYQSERGDFNALMRARISELDTRLEALRVQVDHAKAQAALLYLGGEKR